MSDVVAPAAERLQLDATSWVDVARGWVDAETATELYDTLAERVAWRTSRVFKYDHYFTEPRLGSYWRPGNEAPHPLLVDLHRTVQRAYGVQFDGFALAWYRDGNDSVAFHRDRELKWLDDTVIAVFTLGAQRPWLIRPRSAKYDHFAEDHGATHDLRPAGGDLHVMGGRAQADWEHSVPKRPGLREGRISLQWRWTSRQGRQEIGGSYRKPRRYSG